MDQYVQCGLSWISSRNVGSTNNVLYVWFGSEIAPPDPTDVLPRHKCEDALRAARQARWFEVLTYLIIHKICLFICLWMCLFVNMLTS